MSVCVCILDVACLCACPKVQTLINRFKPSQDKFCITEFLSLSIHLFTLDQHKKIKKNETWILNIHFVQMLYSTGVDEPFSNVSILQGHLETCFFRPNESLFIIWLLIFYIFFNKKEKRITTGSRPHHQLRIHHHRHLPSPLRHLKHHHPHRLMAEGHRCQNLQKIPLRSRQARGYETP